MDAETTKLLKNLIQELATTLRSTNKPKNRKWHMKNDAYHFDSKKRRSFNRNEKFHTHFKSDYSNDGYAVTPSDQSDTKTPSFANPRSRNKKSPSKNFQPPKFKNSESPKFENSNTESQDSLVNQVIHRIMPKIGEVLETIMTSINMVMKYAEERAD